MINVKQIKKKRIMKKSFLMIATAALALTACSQNEELNYNEFKDVAMEFGSDGIDKPTRAELDMDWFQTSGNSFGVYGFTKEAMTGDQIFKNEKVYYDGSNTWKHDNVRFWNKSLNTYNFYAYAPFASGDADVEFGSNGFTFKNLEIFSNVASGDYDKAVANATGIGYSNGTLCTDATHSNAPTVKFIFSHVLSKLQFRIKTTEAADAVADFYLQEICTQFPSASGSASWVQSTPTAASGEAKYISANLTQADLVISSGDAVYASGDAAKCTTLIYASTAASGDAVTTTAAEKGQPYIVVPVGENETDHKFAVKVKYDIVYADGTTEKDCIALGAIKYAPNTNDFYTITIVIDPAKIEFCVEDVEGWDTEIDKEIDVD